MTAVIWTKERAARLGFLFGRGWIASAIGQDLGLTSAQVADGRRMLGLAHEGDSRKAAPVPVQLSAGQRREATRLAKRQGVPVEEWLRRVCVCAIEDDLYSAVTDGRFG